MIRQVMRSLQAKSQACIPFVSLPAFACTQPSVLQRPDSCHHLRQGAVILDVLTMSKGRTMDRTPALSCFIMKFSSANFAPAIHISI